MTIEAVLLEVLPPERMAKIRENLSNLKEKLVRSLADEGVCEQDVDHLAITLLVAAIRDIEHIGIIEAGLCSLPEGRLRNTFRDAMLSILQERLDHYRRFAHRVCGAVSDQQRQRWPRLFAERVDP